MSHVSLYRKYRPATFDEVRGQEHVTRTLVNAIESGKISHAYLFAGSRGTGKTSTAKLLAKALNCAEGPTANPCGKCESCMSISAGASLDVIEMDAASNRGIDDIRDIRDKVAFATVEGKYKVYILDEAHMLTKEASNAFLKVLEEPPGHVIFVLCTTEAHKVLPTIQSRCQRFEFRRPDAGMVLEVLKGIAEAEQIDIDDAGLAAIARSSAGAFRDAIGALDQLETYCDKKITLADVLAMLGTVESELLFEAVDIAAADDARGALLFVNRLADQGKEFGQFAEELTGHLRNIFLLQQLDDYPAGIITAADEDLSRLRGQARLLAPNRVVRFIELLADALAGMKRGSDARLQLELSFIKMTRPEVDLSTKSIQERLERLERRQPSGNEGHEAADAAPGMGRDEPAAAGSEVADPKETGDAGAPSVAAADPQLELSLDKIVRAWSIILTQVQKKKIPLHSLLQEARPLKLENNTLTLGFPAGAEFHKTQVEKPNYMEVIRDVLKEMTGANLAVKCVVAAGDSAPATAAMPREEREGPTADELIALFKAELDAEEIP
ncbi:MAG: DNA polymerase III subunit gamma/tau [Actinobacteria bacterium]|nr:DNA polymerase III subunit gamma/tau [Actinomycetota bacterium]MCL5882827.1 DNA polymerase III subunit gamma/tau [Actinomycetota bacterium]